jgi:hypothetical protein
VVLPESNKGASQVKNKWAPVNPKPIG